VLAAIAVPYLFSNIQQSKAAEAFVALKTYNAQVEGCVQAHTGNESVCNNALNFTDSPNFKYGFGDPVGQGIKIPANFDIANGLPGTHGYDWLIAACVASSKVGAVYRSCVWTTRSGGQTISPVMDNACTASFQAVCS
jgi:hypothetical protein